MYPAVRLTGLLEPASNMHGTTFMFAKHSHTLTQGSSSQKYLLQVSEESQCGKKLFQCLLQDVNSLQNKYGEIMLNSIEVPAPFLCQMNLSTFLVPLASFCLFAICKCSANKLHLPKYGPILASNPNSPTFILQLTRHSTFVLICNKIQTEGSAWSKVSLIMNAHFPHI